MYSGCTYKPLSSGGSWLYVFYGVCCQAFLQHIAIELYRCVCCVVISVKKKFMQFLLVFLMKKRFMEETIIWRWTIIPTSDQTHPPLPAFSSLFHLSTINKEINNKKKHNFIVIMLTMNNFLPFLLCYQPPKKSKYICFSRWLNRSL